MNQHLALQKELLDPQAPPLLATHLAIVLGRVKARPFVYVLPLSYAPDLFVSTKSLLYDVAYDWP